MSLSFSVNIKLFSLDKKPQADGEAFFGKEEPRFGSQSQASILLL